jgi:hypothetical protein
MIYWKNVDIGDYQLYASKMMQYISGQIDLNTCRFWNPLDKNDVALHIPELISGLSYYGDVKEMSILVLRENQQSSLHIDHTAGLNHGVKARINLPILNCEGSTTAFYDLQPGYAENYITNAGGTKTWPQDYRYKLRPASTVELNSPTILRTSAPHTVFCNTGKFPRISLTVSMVNDVVEFLC